MMKMKFDLFDLVVTQGFKNTLVLFNSESYPRFSSGFKIRLESKTWLGTKMLFIIVICMINEINKIFPLDDNMKRNQKKTTQDNKSKNQKIKKTKN